MPETRLIIAYLVAINLIAFLAFGLDKILARSSRRRISEATLLTLAFFGGSLGAWSGMYLFRHKTLHLKFRIGVPLILIAQITVFALCR